MDMNIPQIDEDFYRAKAAEVVLDTLSRHLGAPALSHAAISQPLIPIYGITWNRRILGIVTTDRINKLTKRLRNLGLKQSEYDAMSSFPQRAYVAAPVFPTGAPRVADSSRALPARRTARMGSRPGLSRFSGRTGLFCPEAAGRHCTIWFGNAVWGRRFRGHYPTAMGIGARNFRASFALFLLMPGRPRTTGGRPRPDEGSGEEFRPIRTVWKAQYTYVQEDEAETIVSTSRPYAEDR